MKQVVIYTLSYCPYCKKAKNLLRERNVPFSEIDVTESEEKWTKKIAQEYQIKDEVTYPQIIIGYERIGGCSDLERLINENKLDKLLKED